MKKLLLLFCACLPAFAVGTVIQTITPLGIGPSTSGPDTRVYQLSLFWSGDSITGTVPSTILNTSQFPLLSGYRLVSVEFQPGTPNPSANYSITITDALGIDLLQALGANLSATVASFVSPVVSPPVVTSPTFALSGNSVASAQGRMIAFFSPITPQNPSTVAGIFQSSPPTLSNGVSSPLLLDSTGRLNVDCTAGCGGSGGTASADKATFTVGSTLGTPMMGAVAPVDTVVAGTVALAALDTSRNVKVNCVTGCGGGSGGTSQVDKGTFTVGSTFGTPLMGTVAPSDTVVAGTDAIAALDTARNLKTVVVNTPTVTANAGTNLNTSALALDTSVNGVLVGQASTTSGQKGPLIQGAVTTAAPSYTTAQTDPLSLTTAGALRVDGSAVTQPVSGTVTSNIGTTNGLALDTSINGILLAQASTTSGQKGPLVQCAVTTSAPSYTTAQTDPCSLNTSGGLRVDGSGVTQPVSGTVTANQGGAPWSQNLTQVGGTNIVTGGVAGLIATGGPVASGSANADNPIKNGGVFNTTQPTVTNGQIVDGQYTARGASIVATGVDPFAVNASQTGTWTVQPGNTANTTPWLVQGNLSDNGAAAAGNRIAALPAIAESNMPAAQTAGRDTAVRTDLHGNLLASLVPNGLTTYAANKQGLVPASSPTDIAVLPGNATNTVIVTRVFLSCTQTTAGIIDVQLIKRSTADTAGTSAAMTIGPNDSNNAAAVSAPLTYTANPTLGTAVANMDSAKIGVMAPGTASPNDFYQWTPHYGQSIVLRGTAQQLALNLNGVTLTGGSCDLTYEWIETTGL